MARMIPDILPVGLNRATARIYRELKKIDSEEVLCRISFQIHDNTRPEFMVVYRNCQVFLLSVNQLSSEQLEESALGSLFQPDNLMKVFDLRESHQIENFLNLVFREMGIDSHLAVSIEKWILFPNASMISVEKAKQVFNLPSYRLLGREECRSNTLLALFQESQSNALDATLIDQIRKQFSPESVIPHSWTFPKTTEFRSQVPTQKEFFLDYDQEATVKRDLELSPETEGIVQQGQIRLVTGVAGCGKTLVLLFRARLMARLQPKSRVLILMHNRPLHRDLDARMRELDPDLDLEISTFYSWVSRKMRRRREVIKGYEQLSLLRNLRNKFDIKTDLSDDYLLSEFDWISDNAVDRITLSWYLGVERQGRQRALQRSQREEIFKLFLAYRKQLRKEGRVDWAGIPVIFFRELRNGQHPRLQYDAVYIDEAQFFAPVWFACIKEVLRKKGHLFMVADPTQGFLRHGQSWQQVLGQEIRGRSHRLENPYRNTREILTFAKNFYLLRKGDEETEVNLPSESVLTMMRTGDPPQFIRMSTRQDEISRMIKEVQSAIEGGLPPQHVLIILADPRDIPRVYSSFENSLPQQIAMADHPDSRQKIRLTSLGACPGLESPVVILQGLENLIDRECALNLDPQERLDLYRMNTKKIFVGLTRATRKLLVFYRRPQIFQELNGTAGGNGSNEESRISTPTH